ncbi:GTP cyclohydrolase II [Acrocarpospora pleiomorpha]|uniref:GTP cyclohydrolase-2 n=1 Tax=Acrocarpospora pleiomorpha TaxID=90975 RepID=A0A5M3Y2U4_9ACTN|nr:GTP cyclohydrolase II [Acrocarpospora pleiomorpha]GES26549.1 GTP cyclohydrolase II [Acrocarpospora pleiomorpha]
MRPELKIATKINIPLQVGKQVMARVSMVSFDGLSAPGEHVALIFGEIAGDEAPLVRVHSECLTGDVFRSARCDCGDQLAEAIELMAGSSGILLYLRQEGRGIGLYNKLRAYALQDGGLDTFDANTALNFEHDLRNYLVAAEMLLAIGARRIRLLSNNPDKVRQLEGNGIEVCARVPTGVYENPINRGYLEAKVYRGKHEIVLS